MMTDKRKRSLTHTGRRKDRPTIGYLVSEVQRDFALLPWLGMLDAARKHEVNLISFIGRVLRPPTGFDGQANVVYELAGTECVDGLLIWPAVMGGYLTKPDMEEFCQQYYPSVPVVLLEEVAIDNYQGFRLAVDHLVEVHGYRRIAFAGMFENHNDFRERYRAYTDTLAAHGLPVEAKLAKPWFPGEVIHPSGRIYEDVFRSWLKEAVEAGVEAIVGVCDTIALEIIEILQAQGIRIPGDIAVASFDDFKQSRVVTPPLTTTNPSFYELGQLAMERLLALLAGKPVPEQVVVQPRLIVRQSCGCTDPMVAQAAVGPVKQTVRVKGGEKALNREKVALAMVQAAQADAVEGINQQVERLVDDFMAEVSGEDRGVFLSGLDGVLRQIVAAEGQITPWHDAISTLRRQALPWLGEEEATARAEDVWQQARVMIGKMAERVQAYQWLQAEQRAQVLREVGQALITTFNMTELMDVLAEGLPGLGIPGCYLSLYQEPQPYQYPDPAPEWSRLVLAYNERGRVALEPGGWQFPSRQLAPEELWPQDRSYSFVVEPLYFQYDQIGFVLLEVGPREGDVYEALCGQISNALKGALPVEQEEKRAFQLQSVAEVSMVVSTILDTTELLQSVVDLTKASFKLYHAHIYLLTEASDTLNLAASADEVGRQMVVQGWSIPLTQEQSLVARVARTRQGVIVNNVREVPDWIPNPLLPDTRSELALPMIAGDRLLGVLDLQSDAMDHFTAEDMRIQTTLTAQVAIALQNTRLYAETAQRAIEMEALSQISRRLSAVLDPKQLIAEVVEQVGATFNYYHTQIYLFDEARENMVLAGATGEIGQLMLARQHSLPKGRGLVGWAAEQNKMVLAPDVRRNIGVEIITQANLEGVYQREVDPAVEVEWYARYIAQYFGDVEAVGPDQAGQALKLGYVLHVSGVFPDMLRRGAEAAARDLQVELEVVSPVHGGEHLPLFEAMVRQGKDGLVVVPDQPSWVEPIRQALAAGIPVVTANRDLKFSPALTHVAQDNFQSGTMLARELINLLSAAGKHEGKILVSTGIVDRNLGVRHGLRDTSYTLIEIEGFIELVSVLWTYWEQAISRYPDLIAAVGLTSPETPILAEIKRHTGGQWLIAGYDLEPATLEAVRDGAVQITIGQHPYLQGYLPILALVEHLRQGKSLEGWMAEGWLPNPLLPETKAEVAMPIALAERVLGVLDVHHNIVGSLKQENANLLRSVADQLAVALENARLFEQTQVTLAETENLYNAGRRISAASDLQELVAAVAEVAPVRVINRAVLHVFEYNSAGEMEAMVLLANWYSGLGTSPLPLGTRYPRATFTTIDLFLNPKPLFFDDIQHDERIEDSATLAVLQQQHIRAMAVLPLWIGTSQFGVLLLQSEELHHFAENEIRTYLSLVGPMAVSVENKRLLEQAQARAHREQILREVMAQVHAAADLDTIMRTTVREVGRALGRPAFVYLGNTEKQPTHETNGSEVQGTVQ
jgi:DNA-binding LacI/PurR family transcriptional regulator/GAF domain-containing protein